MVAKLKPGWEIVTGSYNIKGQPVGLGESRGVAPLTGPGIPDGVPGAGIANKLLSGLEGMDAAARERMVKASKQPGAVVMTIMGPVGSNGNRNAMRGVLHIDERTGGIVATGFGGATLDGQDLQSILENVTPTNPADMAAINALEDAAANSTVGKSVVKALSAVEKKFAEQFGIDPHDPDAARKVRREERRHRMLNYQGDKFRGGKHKDVYADETRTKFGGESIKYEDHYSDDGDDGGYTGTEYDFSSGISSDQAQKLDDNLSSAPSGWTWRVLTTKTHTLALADGFGKLVLVTKGGLISMGDETNVSKQRRHNPDGRATSSWISK